MNKTLTIIIPSFNEGQFLDLLLKELFDVQIEIENLGWQSKIILVDDGSTDHTKSICISMPITYIYQENAGKGSAVKRGAEEALDGYVVVLDADGEYSPEDIVRLLSVIPSDPATRIAVYGSRYLKSGFPYLRLIPFPNQSLLNLGFNYFLSILTFLRYGEWITDLLTGYKLYSIDDYRSLTLRSSGFETDHEITKQLFALDTEIIEVGVSYAPRRKSDGKKITSRDALKAIIMLMRTK
jgi:glycosyltransferase involved in cell wall biosynthesis